jgi:membrane fusion protein (multidrug efflux system)
MNAKTPHPPASLLETPAEPPKRRGRLRRLRPLILLLALGAAGIGGTWWWRVGSFLESTDNAYLAGDIAPLASRIEGDVAEILVADNQPVRQGQPLIRLERQDWAARRDGAAASLAAAEATEATLKAQRTQQLATIAGAEAAIRQAEAERVRATQEAQRYETLATGGVGARQAAERTLADQRKAEAALAAATANLAAARAALPVLDAQAAGAEAQVGVARSALALAESNLAYTTIRAPFDGVAGNRAAQIGQHVRPGQALIAVAPPPERQWVLANFKETQLARMREGQPASITLDVSGAVLRGRVASLSPATGSLFSLLPPENATGNFTRIVQRVPVKILLDEPEAAAGLLRPGLSAVAEVDTRDDPAAPRGVLAMLGLGQGLGQ